MEVEKFKIACQDPSSDPIFIHQFLNQPLISIPIIINNLNFQSTGVNENEIIERQRGLIILKRTIENLQAHHQDEMKMRDEVLNILLIISQNLNHQVQEEREIDQRLMNELNEIIAELTKSQCLTHHLTDLDSLLCQFDLNLSTISQILNSISMISNMRSNLIIKRYSKQHFLEFFEKYQTQPDISLYFGILSILSIKSFDEHQLMDLIHQFQSDLLSIIFNSPTSLNEELILQYSEFFLNSNQIDQSIINTYSTIIQHPQLSKPILIKACEIVLKALDSWSSSHSIELSPEQQSVWSSLMISLFTMNPEEEEHSVPSNLFECFSRKYPASILLLINQLPSENEDQLSIKIYAFGLWIGRLKEPIETEIDLESNLKDWFNNLFIPIFRSLNDNNLEGSVVYTLAFTMRKILQNRSLSDFFRSEAQWILVHIYMKNSKFLYQLSRLDELMIGKEGLMMDWMKVLECLSDQLRYELEAYTVLETLICSDLSLINGSTENFCDLIIKTWTIELNETLRERLIDAFNDLILTLETHELVHPNFHTLIQTIQFLFNTNLSTHSLQTSFQILIQSIPQPELRKKETIIETIQQISNPNSNLICSLILTLEPTEIFQSTLFPSILHSIFIESSDEHRFVLIRLILLCSANHPEILYSHRSHLSNLFNLFITSTNTPTQLKLCKLFLDLCLLHLHTFLEILNPFPTYFQTLFNQWKSLFELTNLKIYQKKIIKCFKILGEFKVYEELREAIEFDENEEEEEEEEEEDDDDEEWGERIGLGRFGSQESIRLKMLKDHLKKMIDLDCFEVEEEEDDENEGRKEDERYLLSNSSCESGGSGSGNGNGNGNGNGIYLQDQLMKFDEFRFIGDSDFTSGMNVKPDLFSWD
ncbi:hypothetical protein DFH28DRAFT_1093440 [Melampsora americana]|nr:hypothetical protein DFH28DRAFT_1093440 [Melampsora americana]